MNKDTNNTFVIAFENSSNCKKMVASIARYIDFLSLCNIALYPLNQKEHRRYFANPEPYEIGSYLDFLKSEDNDHDRIFEKIFSSVVDWASDLSVETSGETSGNTFVVILLASNKWELKKDSRLRFSGYEIDDDLNITVYAPCEIPIFPFKNVEIKTLSHPLTDEHSEHNIENYVKDVFTEAIKAEKNTRMFSKKIKNNDNDHDDGEDDSGIIWDDDFFDDDDENPTSPFDRPLKDVFRALQRIKNRLKKAVLGQDKAINSIIRAILNSFMMRNNHDTPRAIVTLIGEPGCGKTMLIRLLFQELEKEFSIPSKVFHMEQYSIREVGNVQFGGSPKSYREASPGEATSFAKNNECGFAMLFDEIEKTADDLRSTLLSMLGNGTMTDKYTQRNVCFKNGLLFFTSNAGKNLYESSGSAYSNISENALIEALRSDIDPGSKQPYFSAPFLSRLSQGEMVVFDRLSPEIMLQIVENRMHEAIQDCCAHTDMEIEIPPKDVIRLLLYSLPNADARVLSRRAYDFISDSVTNHVLQHLDIVKTVKFCLDTITDDEIQKLLCPQEDLKGIIVTDQNDMRRSVYDIKGVLFKQVSCLDLNQDIIRNCDFILIDISDERGQVQGVLRDLRKICNLPIYYIRDSDSSQLDLLLSHGLTGAYQSAETQSETEYLHNTVSDLQSTKILQKLRQANKVILWNEYALVKGKTLEIHFNHMRCVQQIAANDKKFFSEIPNDKFEDIFGAVEAKKELIRIADKLNRRALDEPCFILLQGPPGTGKTSLARAIAHEANRPFLAINGTEVIRSRLGEGAEWLREQCRRARDVGGILFIDEIDSFCLPRDMTHQAQYTEDLLITFMTELDGFCHSSNSWVCICATNRMNSETESRLDPALLRRFNRIMTVPLPDKSDRSAYTEHLLENRNYKLSKNEVAVFADRTVGKSFGDIHNIVKHAFNNENSSDFNFKMLMDALEEHLYGMEKALSEKNAWVTSIHEAGHSLMAYLQNQSPPIYVTRVCRENHLGYTFLGESNDDVSPSKQTLLNRISVFMGGAAAELLLFDEMSSGCCGDLQQATNIARKMVTKFGMGSRLATATFSENDVKSSQNLDEIDSILKIQLETAKRMLSEHKNELLVIANALMERKSLNADELTEVLLSCQTII